MEEQAALYDARGLVIGQAPRSRVRAQNLRHGATSIVLFNPAGEVYVHQRTWVKDVYPGKFDFTAGGVIQAGEAPLLSAQRELEEELGVVAPLYSLGEADYADEYTTYHAFLYWAATDQEIHWQPEEVLTGMWMTREALIRKIEKDPERFMPDAVALLAGWIKDLPVLPPDATDHEDAR